MGLLGSRFPSWAGGVGREPQGVQWNYYTTSKTRPKAGRGGGWGLPSGDWVDEPEGSAVTLDFRPPGPSARHTEAVAGPGSRSPGPGHQGAPSPSFRPTRCQRWGAFFRSGRPSPTLSRLGRGERRLLGRGARNCPEHPSPLDEDRILHKWTDQLLKKDSPIDYEGEAIWARRCLEVDFNVGFL